MAKYTIHTDGIVSLNPYQDRWFSNRNFSTRGSACAQPEFDKIARLFPQAILVRWENHEPTVVQRGAASTAALMAKVTDHHETFEELHRTDIQYG